MPVDSDFTAFLEVVLAPLGHIVTRRMFGGAGMYCDGHFFAIVDGQSLYFKTDAASRVPYEEEGMRSFIYTTKKGEAALSNYMDVPDRLFDEPDEMRAWARASVVVARRAAAQVSGAKPSKPKASGADRTPKLRHPPAR